MKKNKALLVALAMILVCAVSVMGTVAFMKLNTGAVTNTFISAGGGKLAQSLTLSEHLVTKGADGSYSIADDAPTTPTNTYDAMPGMVLPKDPTVTVTDKTDAPAYLYLEMVGELSDDYEWTMDSSWVPVLDGEGNQVTGQRSGKLYVYTVAGNSVLTGDGTTDLTVGIIQGNAVTVADDADLSASESVTFYAYLAQANVGENTTVLSAYNTCFPKP